MVASRFSKFFTRNLTVWPSTIDDRYGLVTFGQPFIIKCFFEKTNAVFMDSKGIEQVAKFTILFDDVRGSTIKDTDYLVIDRDELSVSDPRTISDSYEVGSIGVIAADSIGSLDVYEIMV